MHKYAMPEMILRTVRACVDDHMADDRLARDDWQPSNEDMYDVCPGQEAPPWLRDWDKVPHTERTKDRLEDIRFRREADRTSRFGGLPECRTVVEIMTTEGAVEVLGESRRFETEHSRKDCFVIRITYGKNGMAMADYEVGTSYWTHPVCWQD